MQDRQTLEHLLDQRNEHPEQIDEIDEQIWTRFGRTVAVWVLDMSGFSRLTMRYGITHYLAMIRRMQKTVIPVVKRHSGQLVKAEADNLFVVFDTVSDAVSAALAVQQTLTDLNVHLPEDWDLHVGIGIDHGRVVVIDGEDVFGHAMNVASKLGEDLAGAGDVLISRDACEQLDSELHDGWESLEWSVSGVTLQGKRCR